VKTITLADIAKSVDVSIQGAAKSNMEQQRITDENRKVWTPKPDFVDDKYGDAGMPGYIPQPTFTQLEVGVQSGATEAMSVYQKSLLATERLLRGGQLRTYDIKKILGTDGATQYPKFTTPHIE
jgi:hypothetical protein